MKLLLQSSTFSYIWFDVCTGSSLTFKMKFNLIYIN